MILLTATIAAFTCLATFFIFISFLAHWASNLESLSVTRGVVARGARQFGQVFCQRKQTHRQDAQVRFLARVIFRTVETEKKKELYIMYLRM